MPMNGLPYYKAYPRDFFEGTRGMDGELKGAYRMVLDLIYQHGGRLHNDPGHIAGELGYSVRKWNSLLADLIARGKLHLNDGIISNFRADKELFQLEIVRDKQRENGSKPKNIKHMPEAMAKPRPNHTEPDTDTERKEKTPHTPRKDLVAVGADAPSALVLEFEKVWPAYPRQVAKGAAKKAWIKARKTTEFETIAGPLRQFIKVVRGSDLSKVPHFATWLNEERWNDDQSHARNGPRTSTEDLNGLANIRGPTSAADLAHLMATPLKAIGR